MANITIQKVNGNPAEAGSASPEAEALAEQIRRLAFFLFERRGGGEGHAVEDWLDAEREQDVRVTAWPTALLVKARAAHHHAQADGEVLCCDFEHKTLFRRLEFPDSIDLNRVRAKLVNGVLQVTAARGSRAEEQGMH
ncbi:MAG TPA: DUF2934 domain-containing protein [Bryobacteraceae bacterium]|nr:DUF2934 domain-containing protein [Bryobacteraceae bacterium]